MQAEVSNERQGWIILGLSMWPTGIVGLAAFHFFCFLDQSCPLFTFVFLQYLLKKRCKTFAIDSLLSIKLLCSLRLVI